MTRDTIRLTPEVYRQFEKQFALGCRVTDKTTELQAGYQLGVQDVLRALRGDLVIGA